MSLVSEERLLGLIGRIYDAALDPDEWQPLIEDLARLVLGTAAISSQDVGGGAITIAAASGIDPSFARSYESYYGSKRPWASQAGMITVGGIFTPRIHCAGDYERTEYFNDWLKPQGIYYLSSCMVARRRNRTTFLTLSRSRRHGDFGTDEYRFVRKLSPHLRRALAIRLRLTVATQQRDMLTRSLEALGIGAILVDADGRIGFANSVAECLLQRGHGLVARQQQLMAKTPAATGALRRMINSAARPPGDPDHLRGGVLTLPTAEQGHLHALVCPLPARQLDAAGSLTPRAIVFVSDPGRQVMLRPGDLMPLYGLTRAEAKLMCAMASGSTLDQYVEGVGIARTTAKTQLLNIFRKTGWHRQTDIVRGALTDAIIQIAAHQA